VVTGGRRPHRQPYHHGGEIVVCAAGSHRCRTVGFVRAGRRRHHRGSRIGSGRTSSICCAATSRRPAAGSEQSFPPARGVSAAHEKEAGESHRSIGQEDSGAATRAAAAAAHAVMAAKVAQDRAAAGLPPARRRGSRAILSPPSMTGGAAASQESSSLHGRIIPCWIQSSNRRQRPSTWARPRIGLPCLLRPQPPHLRRSSPPKRPAKRGRRFCRLLSSRRPSTACLAPRVVPPD